MSFERFSHWFWLQQIIYFRILNCDITEDNHKNNLMLKQIKGLFEPTREWIKSFALSAWNMAVYKMLELEEGSPTNFGYMYLCLAKVVTQTFLWS